MRRQLVHAYEDEASFLARVGGFLSEGARNGDDLVIIATPDHARHLRAYVPDPGRCHVVDAQGTLEQLMPGDGVDESRFHRIVGGLLRPDRARDGRRLRAYGQLVQLLGRQGRWNEAVRVEQLWNELGNTEGAALLCGFSLISFLQAGSGLRNVCVEHQDTGPLRTAAHLYPLELSAHWQAPRSAGPLWSKPSRVLDRAPAWLEGERAEARRAAGSDAPQWAT